MIRVGTASWTDKSLIASKKFYPRGCSTAEDRLRYYASRFPMVEVDSSYYMLPSARNSLLWAERTAESFRFNVKAFRLFTGHQTPAVALPRDVAEVLEPHFAAKRNVYYKDVPTEIRDELWARFEAGVRPLKDAGKLQALHFQFAPWVVPSPDWKRHIEECADRLAGYQLSCEFRNRTWFDGASNADTLQFERDLNLAHTVVDEPQNSAKSIPQIWEVGSPQRVVVRIHGRNEGTWDAKGLSAASDRFDYDYSDAELLELSRPIRQLAGRVEDIDVVFNNNKDDQGQRNATTLMTFLNVQQPGMAP